MKDLDDFLDDTQEEIMDALLYIQAAKKCLKEKLIYTGIPSVSKKHRQPGSWA